ncbi:hypothetical protein DID88_009479 [Monilinia fructigena]|uniref:Uncharacterized protein n=1 Tax=Monilinia fructigena TaxID=38457 RepID=A0A395IPK1_9HELO|nr:hypothetical protein DID88_009479 [Monilinia fructigena]
MAMGEKIAVREVLYELLGKLGSVERGWIKDYGKVGGKEVAQEKGQILDKLLVLRVTGIISSFEVKSQGNNLGYCG